MQVINAQSVLILVLMMFDFLDLVKPYYLQQYYHILINHSFHWLDLFLQFITSQFLEKYPYRLKQSFYHLIQKLTNFFHCKQSTIYQIEYHSCELFFLNFCFQHLLETNFKFPCDHYDLDYLIKFCMFIHLHLNSCGFILLLLVNNLILVQSLILIYQPDSLLALIHYEVNFLKSIQGLFFFMDSLRVIFHSYLDVKTSYLVHLLFKYHVLIQILIILPRNYLHFLSLRYLFLLMIDSSLRFPSFFNLK